MKTYHVMTDEGGIVKVVKGESLYIGDTYAAIVGPVEAIDSGTVRPYVACIPFRSGLIVVEVAP